MAKNALKEVQDFQQSHDEQSHTPVPGIFPLTGDRLRVTFDIPAKTIVKVRSERTIEVSYADFCPEGLALQFDAGLRVYNDAIGAIKETDKKEDGTPYYSSKSAFLDECQARAQKKLNAFMKGDGGRTRDTSLDPLEREMLQLGFNHFQANKWTLKRSPTLAGIARFDVDFSESTDANGKPDYGVFKERVSAYVKKFDVVFREEAQENLKKQEERAKKIAAMAQGLELKPA